MTDITIGGRDFKLGKLNALKQFHIVRRVGPMLSDVLPVLASMKDLQKSSQEKQLEEMARLATPVMNGISKLSDADAELVLLGLLSSVEMQQATGNWVKIANDSMFMVQDLELPVMLQLAGRAFIHNLSSFFPAPPQK